ncbi:MAG: hypothetical protein J6Y82_10840 [Bacteroidales bacterium]|nr:hypothetical protein [Bacteroidales bacterium]
MPNEPFTWQEPGAWRKTCIVHVTMVAKDRQPLFGTLRHNGTKAYIERTPIGQALISQQSKMLEMCPEIKILADKVMPDHYHIVLHVTRTMSRTIREVVRGYMQGCKVEARKLGFTENLYDAPPFFRTLCHKGQLDAMIKYVKANAERAWLRKQNPDLFRLHRQTTVCRLTFTSLGNHFLLDWPDRQLITVSRNSSEEEIQQQIQNALAFARYGVVTYTAAISKGEQMIARTIREQGFPLVVSLNDGFPKEGSPNEKYYKPGGAYFESCSKGTLLLLEPTDQAITSDVIRLATETMLRDKAEARHLQYMPVSVTSQRYRFLALNEIGRLLCGRI